MNTPRKKTWLINCTADEDRAKQSFKDECDMNRIVGRISKTGFIPLEAQDSLRRQVFADASVLLRSLSRTLMLLLSVLIRLLIHCLRGFVSALEALQAFLSS